MKVNDSAFNYSDMNSLATLRNQAKQGGDETLMTAAKQMEAVFLNMVLKSMRDANESFKSDYFSSQSQDFYQDFYDNQMSLHLAKGEGMGLAQVIYQQLQPSIGTPSESGLNPSVQGGVPRGSVSFEQMQSIYQAAQAMKADVGNEVNPLEPSDTHKGNEDSLTFNSPREFVEHLLPIAKETLKSAPLNPVFAVAQSALETGWGQHILKDKEGSSHNLFNIKSRDEQGVSLNALEYKDGVASNEPSIFKKYASLEQSFKDYLDLLQTSRYEGAMQAGSNPRAFFQQLQQAGFATDPQYAHKVMDVLASDAFEGLW